MVKKYTRTHNAVAFCVQIRYTRTLLWTMCEHDTWRIHTLTLRTLRGETFLFSQNGTTSIIHIYTQIPRISYPHLVYLCPVTLVCRLISLCSHYYSQLGNCEMFAKRFTQNAIYTYMYTSEIPATSAINHARIDQSVNHIKWSVRSSEARSFEVSRRKERKADKIGDERYRSYIVLRAALCSPIRTYVRTTNSQDDDLINESVLSFFYRGRASQK